MKKTLMTTLVFIGYAIAAFQFSSRGSVLLAQAKSSSVDVRPVRQGNDNPFIWVQRPSAKNDQGSGVGGGKFGGSNLCTGTKERLTAIVPMKDEKSILVQTAQTNPTFWFYVPYTAKLSADFSLRDPKGKPFYKTTLILPRKQGLVGIKLPPGNLLKSGMYQWTFQVICNSQDRAADVYVSGTIEQVKPSSNSIPPSNTTAEKRAVLYAKDGLWSETLTTLIKEVRYKQPQVGTELLTKLLGEYGLSSFAQQPIVLESSVVQRNQLPTKMKGAQ